MIELSTDGTNQGSGLWAYRYLGEGAGIGSGEGGRGGNGGVGGALPLAEDRRAGERWRGRAYTEQKWCVSAEKDHYSPNCRVRQG